MADPVDIFGSDMPPEAAPAPAPAEEEKKPKEGEGTGDGDDEEEDDKNKGGEGSGDEGDDEDEDEIDLDKETDPEKLRAAAKRFQDSSKKKSESIRNLRRSRRQVAAKQNAPEAGEFTPPYSADETTWVKDLPKEKRDGMTDTEKQLWDDNVKVKRQINDDKKAEFDTKAEAARKAAEEIDDSIVLDDELEEFAKEYALEITGDKKRANEVIKYFNRWDNKGLKEEEVMERLDDALKLTKGYQPPKDQAHKKGGAVKKAAGDQFGHQSIVDSLDNDGVKKPIDL